MKEQIIPIDDHIIADYHHEREYLINHVFKFHPVIVDYIYRKYFQRLSLETETVSVHFRLGSDTEPKPDTVRNLDVPSGKWYVDIMRNRLDATKSKYFVISDNTTIARRMIESEPG